MIVLFIEVYLLVGLILYGIGRHTIFDHPRIKNDPFLEMEAREEFNNPWFICFYIVISPIIFIIGGV